MARLASFATGRTHIYGRTPIKRTPSGPRQCVRLIGVCNSDHSRRQRATNLGTVVIKGKRVNGGVDYAWCDRIRGDSFCNCLNDKLKKQKFVLGDWRLYYTEIPR
jgi:hypothetical protein